MPAELTDKQKAALERFKKLKVGALFMRQGTGKTRVALELVNYNSPDYMLYIAPVSTIENARTEIEKWGCCCPYDIIGYETIASSNKKYVDIHDKVEKLKKDGKRTFIIADESIFIKNGKSKRTFRAKELRRFFDYALILNGTPLTRNEWDLFNQMDFLSNKILNMNYREFIKMFFVEHEHKDAYRKKVEALFDNLGNKDPDTIPREAHIWTGKYKKKEIKEDKKYIARNARFKMDNVITYDDIKPGEQYKIIDFCHRRLSFNDYLKRSGADKVEYISTGLSIDAVYINQYEEWKKECEYIYDKTGIQPR